MGTATNAKRNIQTKEGRDLTRDRHSKANTKADCDAQEQRGGKIEGEGADGAPQVLAGPPEAWPISSKTVSIPSA